MFLVELIVSKFEARLQDIDFVSSEFDDCVWAILNVAIKRNTNIVPFGLEQFLNITFETFFDTGHLIGAVDYPVFKCGFAVNPTVIEIRGLNNEANEILNSSTFKRRSV